jgi:plastocyanin
VSNAPLFDTGDIAPLNSAQFVFTSTGTFGYHCSIHPSMTGTIKVNP